VNVIARKTLASFWTVNPDAAAPLTAWYRIARRARWNSFADVRKTFNSVDQIAGSKLVFNIGGNNYRLVVLAAYRNQRLFVLWVGTHAEYDKIDVAEL
jgi:mRNA interferase HigB